MIKMMNNTPKPTDVAGARVALYAAGGSTLVNCARYAERSGLRVVTMIEKPEVSSGLGGARLDALVGRLDHGEFEVIVADAGDGRVVTIAGVSLDAQQSAAVLNRSEIGGGERVAWEASVWRFMVMRSIKEATAKTARVSAGRSSASSLTRQSRDVRLVAEPATST